MGLRSPADTHQVIHVRRSGALSHFPSKAKAPAAPGSALRPHGDGGDPAAAFLIGSIPLARGANAPRLLVLQGHPARTQLLVFLRCASPARALRSLRDPLSQARESARGSSALGLGFAGPRGPGAVGWAPRGRSGGGRSAGRRACCVSRFLPDPAPHRALALPPRSASCRAIRPLYTSRPEAGRGLVGGAWGGGSLGAALLPGRCSSLHLVTANANSCRKGWGPPETAVLPCTLPL